MANPGPNSESIAEPDADANIEPYNESYLESYHESNYEPNIGTFLESDAKLDKSDTKHDVSSRVV